VPMLTTGRPEATNLGLRAEHRMELFGLAAC
jgi:hypothetical protein